jgi:porin
VKEKIEITGPFSFLQKKLWRWEKGFFIFSIYGFIGSCRSSFLSTVLRMISISHLLPGVQGNVHRIHYQKGKKMKNLRTLISAMMFLPLGIIGEAQAGITENFRKFRADGEEKGISWEAAYTLDYLANTRGGLKRDETYLSNLDMAVTLDTQRLGFWEDGTFFIYAVDNSGDEKLTGAIVGDLQGISNIEVPRTTRIHELWYEHQVIDDKLAVLMGIQDYNSEFDVTEYGGLYLNSSFGIGPEITKNGRAGVFPLAAPGVRVKWTPQEPITALLGVYDGDPGDPEISEHFPRSDFDREGGVLIAAEVAYQCWQHALAGSIKLGVWHNTGDFNDLVEVDSAGDPIKRDGNLGGYLVVDKMLYREKDEQGLGAFLQVGTNRQDVNTVQLYTGGGLNYRGLIPGRDEDQLGVAVANAVVNDDLVDAGGREDHETTIELTYSAQMTENIRIQPDFQYVVNPGAVLGVTDAFVAGARFEMAL